MKPNFLHTMEVEIEKFQKRIILGIYIYIYIDVLTDIDVYTLPDELDSYNFQDKFLLCPNKQEKLKILKFLFYSTPPQFFKMFTTPRDLTYSDKISYIKVFDARNSLVSFIARKTRVFELYFSHPYFSKFFKMFRTF